MLPDGMVFIQRDWLSSNSLLLLNSHFSALIDTGYECHAPLLADLIHHHLADQPLDQILNTHLHSDHCGGNALLQRLYPNVQIGVPCFSLETTLQWDEDALTYQATGQTCPRFQPHFGILPGDSLELAGFVWEALHSPGHDNESLIFFEPTHRLLISADALWESGLAVVFPAFLGGPSFDAVARSLDLIEGLNPKWVIPGHGPMFSNPSDAIALARSRLHMFDMHPDKHAWYAAKVMVKFKLMAAQSLPMTDFLNWADQASLLSLIHAHYFDQVKWNVWLESVCQELIQKKAISCTEGVLHNH
jgi:glyoxylase-like metal-dependent hydrolase (beta-lactamase superfamily II)